MGSATELGLLLFAKKFGYSYQDLRNKENVKIC